MGKIHLFLGPFIMVLGVVNGGLGFNFAGNIWAWKPYVVIVLLVAIVFLGIRAFTHFCRGRSKKREVDRTAGIVDGYQYPQFGPGGGPPQYGQGRQESYQSDVPLQPYESQQSIPPPYGAPQYPRPMV